MGMMEYWGFLFWILASAMKRALSSKKVSRDGKLFSQLYKIEY